MPLFMTQGGFPSLSLAFLGFQGAWQSADAAFLSYRQSEVSGGCVCCMGGVGTPPPLVFDVICSQVGIDYCCN